MDSNKAAIREQYALLVLRGYHPKAAKRIVLDKAQKILGHPVKRIGMGQDAGEDVLARLAAVEAIKAAREMVSPWLWVTSLVGFGLAILNTRRIARMYKGWRGKRASA